MKYLFIVFLFLYNLSNAQPVVRDSSDVSLTNALSYYKSVISNGSHLYNGIDEEKYNFRLIGHPYYESKDWQTGSVFYQGFNYENVPLLYDIVSQQLILRHHDGYLKVQLFKEMVDGFTLGNHRFVHITRDTTATIDPGYFELLADGKSRALARKYKIIDESIVGDQVVRKTVDKEEYYISKGTTYYKITNLNTLLKVFSSRKEALQKYIKKNTIKFKENREDAIIKITRYYNELER